MPLYYGSTKLRQKVVEVSGLSPEVVHRVLDAYDATVKELVAAGVHVWVADIGHLVKVTRAPTRRRHPASKELVDVPAKECVVLRQPKAGIKKKRLSEEPI